MRICVTYFGLALTVLQSGQAVHSAEILVLGTVPLSPAHIFDGQCTHRLVGEISSGDAERFQQLVSDLGGQDNDDKNFLLCLDSPGGSISEAFALGETIKSNYFGTYVPAGATCLSACAVAFMHGRIAYFENIVNHRMMHPTATLGFHAPRLDLPASIEIVPVEMVNASYAAAVSVMAELAKAAALPSNNSKISTIPTSLLAQMLSTPPESFLYVDQLYEAFLWDIEIFPNGLVPPAGFELDLGYYQMCANSSYELNPSGFDWFYTEANRRSAPELSALGGGSVIDREDIEAYRFSQTGFVPSIPEGHAYVDMSTLYAEGCSYMYMKEFDVFHVRKYFETEFQAEVFLPSVYLFRPDAKIADLWQE